MHFSMHHPGCLLLLGILTFWAELSPGSGQGTPAVKEGTCPAPIQGPNQLCGNLCSTDGNCPGQQKCCKTSCGQQCQLPIEYIRGYCPNVPLVSAIICLAKKCRNDESCENNNSPGQKCCAYGCCKKPEDEHPGVCLKKKVVQTSTPCKDTCRDDRDCSLSKKCCFTGCGLGCLETVRAERCQLPLDTGTCNQEVQRYYYNPARKTCLPFVYRGYQGNSNNFVTEYACQQTCEKISPEVCKLPKVRGPCLDTAERYYYDGNSKTCKTFEYGGCQGNGNRFATKTECMMVCGNQNTG